MNNFLFFRFPLENPDPLAYWSPEVTFYASKNGHTRMAGPALIMASAQGPQRLLDLDAQQKTWEAPQLPEGPVCFFYAPFETDSPASLFLPSWQIHSHPESGSTLWLLLPNVTSKAAAQARFEALTLSDGIPCPLPTLPEDPAFEALVTQAIKTIHDKVLQKVVLSRLLRLPRPQGFSLPHSLAELQKNQPQATTFAIIRPQDCFFGATPEPLVQKTPLKAYTLALGGSHQDSHTLLNSPKERHEHALIVQDIVLKWTALGLSPEYPQQPECLQLPHITHLSTPICADCPKSLSLLALAHATWPTPAICGTPQAAAYHYIRTHEPHKRGLYTGLFGYQDAHGCGDAYVALRCASLNAQALTLYAGAGIVESSEPSAEKCETDQKFRTVLSGLRKGG